MVESQQSQRQSQSYRIHTFRTADVDEAQQWIADIRLALRRCEEQGREQGGDGAPAEPPQEGRTRSSARVRIPPAIQFVRSSFRKLTGRKDRNFGSGAPAAADGPATDA